MAKFTNAQRKRVREVLPAKYDRSTLRIHRDGTVTARIDPNVVPGPGPFPLLYLGTVDDILREAP